MDEVTATAAARASRLGQSLNEVTGYDEIEKLKKAVADNGSCMCKLTDERLTDHRY